MCLILIGLDLFLNGINYITRVKFRYYVFEVNPIWRVLDKKDPRISILISSITSVGLFSAFSYFAPSDIKAFFYPAVLGALLIIILVDSATLMDLWSCVRVNCPFLKQARNICADCRKKKGILSKR